MKIDIGKPLSIRIWKTNLKERTFDMFFSLNLGYGNFANRFNCKGLWFHIALLRFGVREMDTFGWGIQIPLVSKNLYGKRIKTDLFYRI